MPGASPMKFGSESSPPEFITRQATTCNPNTGVGVSRGGRQPVVQAQNPGPVLWEIYMGKGPGVHHVAKIQVLIFVP